MICWNTVTVMIPCCHTILSSPIKLYSSSLESTVHRGFPTLFKPAVPIYWHSLRLCPSPAFEGALNKVGWELQWVAKGMKHPITSVSLLPSVLWELSLPLHIQNAVAFKLSVSLSTRVITLEQRGSVLSATTVNRWLFIKTKDSEKTIMHDVLCFFFSCLSFAHLLMETVVYDTETIILMISDKLEIILW